MSKKMKIKRMILCALLISLPVMSKIAERDIVPNQDVQEQMCITNDTAANYADSEYLKMMKSDSIKNEILDEAHEYIMNRYPGVDSTIPTHIVEYGLMHNIDILFMMSQTQLETCYGTKGIGRKSSKKSLFGVAARKYSEYDKAVEDYIAILKKHYLTKGRTENHLMKNFVTSGGSRYASNPNYEAELRKTYRDIDRQTNIADLQKEYMNM